MKTNTMFFSRNEINTLLQAVNFYRLMTENKGTLRETAKLRVLERILWDELNNEEAEDLVIS